MKIMTSGLNDAAKWENTNIRFAIFLDMLSETTSTKISKHSKL